MIKINEVHTVSVIARSKLPHSDFVINPLTDWQMIAAQLKDSVCEVWFENLNFYSSIRGKIFGALMRIDRNLIKEYKNIYAPGSNYWIEEQAEIESFCNLHNIPYRICFHHI